MMSVGFLIAFSLTFAVGWVWAIIYCIINRPNPGENTPLLYNE